MIPLVENVYFTIIRWEVLKIGIKIQYDYFNFRQTRNIEIALCLIANNNQPQLKNDFLQYLLLFATFTIFGSFYLKRFSWFQFILTVTAPSTDAATIQKLLFWH